MTAPMDTAAARRLALGSRRRLDAGDTPSVGVMRLWLDDIEALADALDASRAEAEHNRVRAEGAELDLAREREAARGVDSMQTDTAAALRWIGECEGRYERRAAERVRGMTDGTLPPVMVADTDTPLLCAIARAAVEYRDAERAMEEAGSGVDADHRYYAARDALDAALAALGRYRGRPGRAIHGGRTTT